MDSFQTWFFPVLIFGIFKAVLAADPDPLQDICAADFASPISMNGYACKPLAQHSVQGAPMNLTPNNYTVTRIFVNHLAGLNTAGVGIGLNDLGPSALNTPHIHQRATELILVTDGRVRVGFVSPDNGLLFMDDLDEGDVMVIPRGALHFELNLNSTTPARFYAVFNSQNPGTERLPEAIFGTGIPNEILEVAFKLSKAVVANLTKIFGTR